jgi:hypothetical protein
MKIITTLCLLGLAFSGYAQSSTDEINLIQQLYGMEKREILNGFIQFDEDDDKTAFWEVYDEYEALRKEQGQARFKLLEQYVNDYLTMSEAELDGMLAESIKMRAAHEKLVAKYTKKLKKIAGVKQAAQFYQIENYLHGAINTSLAEQIPFIGELD